MGAKLKSGCFGIRDKIVVAEAFDSPEGVLLRAKLLISLIRKIFFEEGGKDMVTNTFRDFCFRKI